MPQVRLHGEPVQVGGLFPAVDSAASESALVGQLLADVDLGRMAQSPIMRWRGSLENRAVATAGGLFAGRIRACRSSAPSPCLP